MYRIRIIPHTLHFKKPVGTSRGVYTTRRVHYLLVFDDRYPCRTGIGECAPLPALSCDDLPDYDRILSEACRRVEQTGMLDRDSLRPYPSILFGLETAMRHIETGSFALWNTPFSRGEAGIPINGLIWMGDYDAMLTQIETKMEAGFRCVKLKIGAIDFDRELDLLRHIRRHFSPGEIELRVDANGAFSPSDALEKLKRLSDYAIHSIEQPIRAGQREAMTRLVRETPIPIALDEELIGHNQPGEKQELIRDIRPHYIILKPSLHGGMHGSAEWIAEAEAAGTGWWITSALESNIGLNAIAQWSATLGSPLPQGLGTGALFTSNIPLPLHVRGDCLWYDPFSSAVEENNIINEVKLFNQTIKLNNRAFTLNEIKNDRQTGKIPDELLEFLISWFDDSPTIDVQTSGSTGTPKSMAVDKKRMTASAVMTCTCLGLHEGDKALLCMPLRYIGSKMMVVRALVQGLDLEAVEPDGHPLASLATIPDFAAMVPLQVYNSLREPKEKDRLYRIRTLIIGGGSIDKALEREIREMPHAVYSTYGMTETLSHIALRRLNGPQASDRYTPLPGVQLSLSPDGTLQINAPGITEGTIATNDLAVIHPDGSFAILGRKDNVINTGGIKIQIETLEDKLANLLDGSFAITSLPDPKFGETVVLLAQAALPLQTRERLKSSLTKYEYPKHIFDSVSIPLAGNGKIDRTACKRLAESLIQGDPGPSSNPS